MAQRPRSRQRSARRPAGRGFWPWPGLLIVGAVASVAVVVLVVVSRPAALSESGRRDNAVGPATAAVTVEEWGDFQ